MQINWPENAPEYEGGNLREGNLSSKVLLKGREGSLNNYRLSYEKAEVSWTTPRHRHNFDQIRLAIAGNVDYGKGSTLPPGWVGYFPESVHYGPQVRDDGSITLGLQFGGASCNGFMSPQERRLGFDALGARGLFEKGAFTHLDEKGTRHRQDAYEAVWEFIRGRKMEYSVPRYDSQVRMDPAAYQWLADENSDGIARKRIGSFTERNLQVGYIRVDSGAKLVVDLYEAPQILFLSKGSVAHQGRVYGLHTAFGLDAAEGPLELLGVEASEVLHVQLPAFDAKSQAALTDAGTVVAAE